MNSKNRNPCDGKFCVTRPDKEKKINLIRTITLTRSRDSISLSVTSHLNNRFTRSNGKSARTW